MKNKRRFASLLAATLITSFISIPPVNAASSSVSVDTSTTYQTMEGFGGAIAWGQELLTEHPNKKEIYTKLFFDSGLDILRLRNQYRNSNNFDYGDTEIVKIAKILNPSMKVLLCSWSPPASLKKDGAMNGGTLAKENGVFVYDKFADYWYNSLNAYKAKGISPDYMSIQNEVDFENSGWETCIFKPTEDSNYPSYGKALDAVYNKLGTLSSAPKILAPETAGIASSLVQDYAKAMDLTKVYGIAHHLYNGGEAYNPDSFNSNFQALKAAFPDKPLFQTEYDQGTSFTTAQLIHNSLVEEGANGYFFWDLIWENNKQRPLVGIDNPFNQSGWSNTKGYSISEFYPIIQHYAKYTDPGFKRVAATSSSSDIKASAFISPDKTKLTIVMINKGYSESTVDLNLNGYSASSSAVYRTVSGGTDSFTSLGSLSGNTVTMPAQSVVTVALGFPAEDNPPEIPGSPEIPASRSAYSQIEAELYNSMKGIQTELMDDNGNRNVDYIQNGDYVGYTGVDFGNGAKGFQARVASNTGGGNIEIRLDDPNGKAVATIPAQGTGDWGVWKEVSADVSGITGKHDLYLYFSGGSDYLFNLDWFKFTGQTTDKKGDLNGDGSIDALDFSLMKSYLLGIIQDFPVTDGLYVADLNNDNHIDALDFSLLKQYLLKIITEFPAKN